jgi:hypothetical protein
MKKIWTEETIAKEALKYETREDFKNCAPGALDAANNMGILDNVCAHMRWIRRPWTDKELAAEALKYKSRNEFRLESSGAYSTARNRLILDKICSHMPVDLKKGSKPYNKKWNVETIAKEALKYSERHKFKKYSEGAYDAAKDLKILDSVCSHMKISRNSSSYESFLLNEIKKISPNVRKLIDRKVQIEGKPHIKGLHVDIFDPDSNKGIEFDGTYWHSLEGLRRTRSHWPESDLLNYHAIKDAYFASRGISILHIKEEAWLQNPTQSLQEILNFLRK